RGMKRLMEKRYILRRNMMAIIGLCLSFYFCYHLVAGQRGYLSLMSLENRITTVSSDYESHKAERQALEKKVVMMRPGSIDRDLLEERARHVLGYRYQDELILLQDRS
ncbi:MAG TPA: septum formation initiator family protein, partial [Alphaproteobacteria bacterium]|nr:septum formation initiator family protein [Alphaproteobacteria bacterium]